MLIRGNERRAHAVAGVLAAALAVGCGRWGSYLGYAPVFLTDLLLVAAAVNFVIFRAIARHGRVAPRGGVPATLILVFGWAFLRLLAGFHIDVDVLRDAFPYLYALAGVLAFAAVRVAGASTIRATWQILFWAMTFHTAWVFLSTIAIPNLRSYMPTLPGGVSIFQTRGDYDMAVVGAYLAVLLHLWMTGARHRFWMAIGIAASAVIVLTGHSRAALLGGLLAVIIALVSCLSPSNGGRANWKRVLVGFLPILLAVIGFFILTTEVGLRLLATFLPAAAETDVGSGAAGTADARRGAWDALVTWTLADPFRALFGVGFGPNIMVESGAGDFLINDYSEGENRPRSPHNYWLGSFARLGLVGLVLLVIAVVRFIRRAYLAREQLATDRFSFLVAIIPISLIIPATLGVVLESPFGAVPFWWCIGAFLAITTGSPPPDQDPFRVGRGHPATRRRPLHLAK